MNEATNTTDVAANNELTAIPPLLPCEHRLAAVSGTNGARTWLNVSCDRLNGALGWEHRAGESLCVRCIAHCGGTGGPVSIAKDGADPLSKAYRMLALFPIQAKLPDVKVKEAMGMDRHEAVERAKQRGFSHDEIMHVVIKSTQNRALGPDRALALVEAHDLFAGAKMTREEFLRQVHLIPAYRRAPPRNAREAEGRQANAARMSPDAVLNGRSGAGKRLQAITRPFKERPCIHIDVDRPIYDHACKCGVTYPCDKFGRCVISARNDLMHPSCVHCKQYEPAADLGGKFLRQRWGGLRWSVGVTTAPRSTGDHNFLQMARERGFKEGPALDATLASLRDAGFGDVTVFAEPGSHRPDAGGTDGLPVLYESWVDRSHLHGSWDNWRQALDHLCRFNPLEPDPEAVLLVQDDVLFCKGLREFLDATLWPKNAALVSLYCSDRYAKGGGIRTVNVDSFWGALAFAFRPEQAEELLASKLPNTLDGNRIDNRVGMWANSIGKKLWVFTPSLTQHTGERRSSMRHGWGKGMSASDFVGEGFDARSLIAEPAVIEEPAGTPSSSGIIAS